jgi:hypothetical protein
MVLVSAVRRPPASAPDGMDVQAMTAWLTALGDAWERRNADAAAALFAPGATFQPSPFGELLRGRSRITAHWAEVLSGQQAIRFRGEILGVGTTYGSTLAGRDRTTRRSADPGCRRDPACRLRPPRTSYVLAELVAGGVRLEFHGVPHRDRPTLRPANVRVPHVLDPTAPNAGQAFELPALVEHPGQWANAGSRGQPAFSLGGGPAALCPAYWIGWM